MTRRTMIARVALGVLLATVMAACSNDGEGAGPVRSTIDPRDVTTSSTEALPVGALPPAAALDLEEFYGDQLAALGLRLTDRGGLIDRRGGGYTASPTGMHLALYVEPIDDRTVPQYIDGIRAVGAILSDAFERWPGLASFDVCQEPVDPDGTQGPEPLPVTQIELTRAEVEAIDWDTVSVIDLVRAASADPPGLALRVSSSLARDPAYVAVVDEAAQPG